MTFDVCVVGSFMKDLVASAPRRPHPGETLHGTGFAEYLGGKGVNQAVAAARMGARTAIIGTLGRDRYGEEFLELLAENGIDSRAVERHTRLGTGVGLPVVLPDGSNSIIIVSRANQAITPASIGDRSAVITSSRVLTAQLELPVDATQAALRAASEAGVTTILNPAPAAGPLDPGLGALVDILVPNEVEAEALSGVDCDEDNLPAIARKLADAWDLSGCVITLGARGAFVLDRTTPAETLIRIAPHRVDTVDTVGAGDAFCGALAAALATGESLVAATRLANAAAALSTTRDGATTSIPERGDVLALLEGSPSSGIPAQA
jgi:ribokinase